MTEIRRASQGILDVLNWELLEDDYRALARLPQETTSADIASEQRSTALVYDAELN